MIKISGDNVCLFALAGSHLITMPWVGDKPWWSCMPTGRLGVVYISPEKLNVEGTLGRET